MARNVDLDQATTVATDLEKVQAPDDVSSSAAESVAKESEAEEALPPQRLVLLVMIFVIQGYTLTGPLQHSFKEALHIADTGTLSHVFTQAAAFVQWGKFAMTLGQNVLLQGMAPIARVYLAMVGMTLGTLVPPFCVYLLGSSWLGWVFISFGLIGLSLGVFECTFLNVITPLGPLTKSWAIMGFPGAFAIINVIGMTLVSFGVPVQALFWYVACGVPLGALLFSKTIAPQIINLAASSEGNKHGGNKQATVWKSLQDWQAWLPRLLPFMLTNIVGHFVMEGALPANFNAYNGHEVPLLGPTDNSHLMNKQRFFVVFFIFVGLGDMLSRRCGYCFKLETYSANFMALGFGMGCSLIGMYLTTRGIAWLAWASAFLAFWGQGFMYAVSSKYIDRFIPREHNLAAYSFWMFAGSLGAIAGSTTVDVIRGWICHGHTYAHECLTHHH